MKYDTPELANLIKDAGYTLFDSVAYSALTNKAKAQNQLAGRTHYVDDGTLKGFGSRILQAQMSCRGLVFYIMESLPKDNRSGERGFRMVAFDIFGECLLRRLPRAELASTSAQAEKRFWAEFNEFDLQDHYLHTLQLKLDRLNEERTKLQKLTRKLKVKP